MNTVEIVAEAGKHDFLIIREFNASKENVFRAFSEPEYLKEWFMPAEMGFTIEQMDCKTGGYFQNHHTHPNGMKFGFKGVYHEVIAPDLIIKTSEFIGLPQKMTPVLEKTTFETIDDGKTKVTIHTICVSNEFRDAMIQNGMKNHLNRTYVLLDQLLMKFRK
jgi:uncharacterized protein YndB with AHSA1/START domain